MPDATTSYNLAIFTGSIICPF